MQGFEQMQRLRKTGMVLIVFVVTAIARSQGIEPLSLKAPHGVHIEQHDARTHRSIAHYEALCRVVLQEFNITLDSIAINLVFIDEDLRDHLSKNNQFRFQAKDWMGAYVPPSLIFIVGEEESDDTFMHEFMHYLNDRGVLFADVPASRVHATIEKNEGLLLGSKSYLQLLAAER